MPTARVAEIFEADVFGNGIKIWLLSQGDVKIISAEELVITMHRSVNEMWFKYQHLIIEKSTLRCEILQKSSFNYKKNWLDIKYYFLEKYSRDFKGNIAIWNQTTSEIFDIRMPNDFYMLKNPKQFMNNNLYLDRYKNHHEELLQFISKLDMKNEIEIRKELSQRLDMKFEQVTSFRNNNLFKKILVTATMSAGKSTLVNALIGKKIMTTQNESCTAKKYSIKEDLSSEGNIYCLHNNTRMRLKKNIPQILHNINSDNVVIYSKMSHIQDSYLWEIIDTPGVNSSDDHEHKVISEELIRIGDFDVLLYVMNGNHLGTNDDISHLQFIKNNVPGEKIIFVINKVDQYRNNHDSVEQSVDNVKIQLENLGFVNPVIQPISAYTGYLLKLNNSNQLLNDEEKDELELLTRKFKRTNFDLTKYNFPFIAANDENQEKLYRCGLYNLELLISRRDVSHG